MKKKGTTVYNAECTSPNTSKLPHRRPLPDTTSARAIANTTDDDVRPPAGGTS